MNRLELKVGIVAAIVAVTAFQCFQSFVCAAPPTTARSLPVDPDELIYYGLVLVHKQKWQSAIPYFAKCLKLKPDLDTAWIEISRCYIEVKDFISAEKTLQQAHKLFVHSPKTLKSILLLLMNNESESGQLEALQQSRKEFVAKFPEEKYTKSLREEIEFYDKDFADTKKRESRQETLGMEGYLPWFQLTMMPAMPIKVCIAPGKVVNPKYTKSVSEKYAALSRKALNEWASVTDKFLTFVFVDNPGDAQLRIMWTTDSTERAHSWADGQAQQTQNATQGPVCSNAMIYLEPKEIMTDSRFYFVCLHELGHALGLPHTSNPADIMYGASSCAAHLSKGDIAYVRGLYTYPFMGRAIARSFADAAFVNKDYEKAYGLLSKQQRTTISQVQFQQSIENVHAGLRPLTLEVNHFERTRHSSRMNFALIGNNQLEKFYYHVSVVSDPNEDFKVQQWNRIRAD